jgi:hypothetical protein
MDIFNKTLDELFVNVGFSLEQYRTLYHILAESSVFLSSVDFITFVNNYNNLHHWSLRSLECMHDTNNKFQILESVIRELIVVGAGDNTWGKYGYGIPLLISCLLHYFTKYQKNDMCYKRLLAFQDQMQYSPSQLTELRQLKAQYN